MECPGVYDCVDCALKDTLDCPRVVEEDEIDCEYTDEIVCPHCGQMHSDSWVYSDSGIYDCEECEKPFSYERNVSVTYSTSKEEYKICPKCNKEEVLFKVRSQSSKTSFKEVCESCKDKLKNESFQEEYDCFLNIKKEKNEI